MAKLRKQAKDAKEALSTIAYHEYEVILEAVIEGEDVQILLTKAEFDVICEPIFAKLVPVLV